MNWQPIDTAPIEDAKPSVPLLLYCPGVTSWNRYGGYTNPPSEIIVGAWNGSWWESDIGDVDSGYESTGAYFVREQLRPTHWQPLPPPPDEVKE